MTKVVFKAQSTKERLQTLVFHIVIYSIILTLAMFPLLRLSTKHRSKDCSVTCLLMLSIDGLDFSEHARTCMYALYRFIDVYVNREITNMSNNKLFCSAVPILTLSAVVSLLLKTR